MNRIVELLVIDIDRLCAQYNELTVPVSTAEETEKRRVLKLKTEAMIERVESVLNAWVKEKTTMMQRVADAMARLTECSEKTFQSEESPRLKSIREGIKRKINQYTETGRNRRIQATVNVNVNIDRNLLSETKSTQEKRPATKQVGSPGSSRAFVTFSDETGSGSKPTDADQKTPSTISETESPRAEREKLPMPANDDDRSSKIVSYFSIASGPSSSSTSEDAKSLRTNTGIEPMAPEEKTSYVWMNDKEDKSPVMPADLGENNAAVNQRPKTEQSKKITQPPSPVVPPPSKTGIQLDKRSDNGKSGKRKDFKIDGVQRLIKLLETPSHASEKDESAMTKSPAATQSSSKPDGKNQSTWQWSDVLKVVLLMLSAAALAFFAPSLRRVLVVLLGAADRWIMILHEHWCSVANRVCERYGKLCSDRCVSGMQLDIWESHRM